MSLRSLKIREVAGVEEYPGLVAIWRSAVDATHDFLDDAYRDEIQGKLASDYFPNVQLFVAELDGAAVGFAGVAGENLEMLFVHANYRGQGIGKALLSYTISQGIRLVEVNEQNH